MTRIRTFVAAIGLFGCVDQDARDEKMVSFMEELAAAAGSGGKDFARSAEALKVPASWPS